MIQKNIFSYVDLFFYFNKFCELRQRCQCSIYKRNLPSFGSHTQTRNSSHTRILAWLRLDWCPLLGTHRMQWKLNCTETPGSPEKGPCGYERSLKPTIDIRSVCVCNVTGLHPYSEVTHGGMMQFFWRYFSYDASTALVYLLLIIMKQDDDDRISAACASKRFHNFRQTSYEIQNGFAMHDARGAREGFWLGGWFLLRTKHVVCAASVLAKKCRKYHICVCLWKCARNLRFGRQTQLTGHTKHVSLRACNCVLRECDVHQSCVYNIKCLERVTNKRLTWAPPHSTPQGTTNTPIACCSPLYHHGAIDETKNRGQSHNTHTHKHTYM